jgi:hypothetical protein
MWRSDSCNGTPRMLVLWDRPDKRQKPSHLSSVGVSRSAEIFIDSSGGEKAERIGDKT